MAIAGGIWLLQASPERRASVRQNLLVVQLNLEHLRNLQSID